MDHSCSNLHLKVLYLSHKVMNKLPDLSQLVFQEVSDLWRATTPDTVNISDNFSQREFAAALQHLKPGKTLGPHSICPKLILHARDALKSWLCDFLLVCADSKIPRSGEERLWS